MGFVIPLSRSSLGRLQAKARKRQMIVHRMLSDVCLAWTYRECDQSELFASSWDVPKIAMSCSWLGGRENVVEQELERKRAGCGRDKRRDCKQNSAAHFQLWGGPELCT